MRDESVLVVFGLQGQFMPGLLRTVYRNIPRLFKRRGLNHERNNFDLYGRNCGGKQMKENIGGILMLIFEWAERPIDNGTLAFLFFSFLSGLPKDITIRNNKK